MQGLFMTGTDTDAGKTIATVLLTHCFMEHGVNIFPFKPVQSGAEERDGQWVAPDVEQYKVLPGLQNERMFSCLYKKASSPHLAAEKEGAKIEVDLLKTDIQEQLKPNRLLLTEGAGGLFVPLNRQGYCIVDLIEELKFPVVIAAKASLGTINHTMLTVEALKKRKVTIAGIILSSTVLEDPEIEADNRLMIEKLSGVPVIGTIPYIENIEEQLADAAFRTKLTAKWNIEKIKEEINHGYTATV
ncbi:dethiobiotin synthetase [Bacillus ectoiniformans]|uniref:dethiobiotin synthase n=1 Tax=Bacillus ectoiniformans TaxID=1494429 RepID=UPI0019580A8C|nr:dethiobiotin synthase [Bacillus ectoiniformans]MBM7649561.1 dethiobiotin synthetase [Bacillus ectoiniformans]